MRRTVLIVVVSVLIAGGIGAGLTALLWDNNEEALVLPTPGFTTAPPATPTVSPSPTATGSPTASPSSESAAPAAPRTQAPSGGGSPPATQSARSVNCQSTPRFCSDTTGGMVIKDEKLVSKSTTPHGTDYSGVPKTTMSWRILHPANREAQQGEKVAKLVVTAVVQNNTNRTFVFPRREIALDVRLDGKEIHKLVTSGESFEMRPGGTLKATFNIPIAFDGRDSWRAKTWYYQK